MLYFGAAGVIWALNYLSRIGATTIETELFVLHDSIRSINRRDLNLSPPDIFSYLMGDVGILTGSMASHAHRSLADEILRAVEKT